MTWMALPMTSAGRFSPLGPLVWSLTRLLDPELSLSEIRSEHAEPRDASVVMAHNFIARFGAPR
jgi:hypothetical protein